MPDNEVIVEIIEQIVAGEFPVTTMPVLVKTGQTLKRGNLLSIDSVTKKAVLASDDQKDYFGVLIKDIDTTAGDLEINCIVTGELFKEFVTATTGHLIDLVSLRNKSIFLR